MENSSPILDSFCLPKGERTCELFGNGLINHTYRVTVRTADGSRRFILQRVNRTVFKNPKQVMFNIERITEYLRSVLKREGDDPARGTLTLIPTVDGKSYALDEDGELWRVYVYIEGVTALDTAKTPEEFALSGVAFGRFQRQLNDFSAQTLYETIPGFHDTPSRYRQLMEVASRDPFGRRMQALPEIDFIATREAQTHLLVDALLRGDLPLRVTHNDAKLNNVLLDVQTGKGICVIDLDTVMPGLVAYDFGDSIRFGASTAAEDESDVAKVDLSLDYFKAYTQGYLGEAGCVLTRLEIETLPLGAKLITLEQGIRFLTDYLNGDVYYHTCYPGQNLVRARTQLQLVQRMEEKWDKMNGIIRCLFHDTH